MPNPNKGRGYRFEKLCHELWEEANVPCVRPHGSSGASLRTVGLTPTSAGDEYDDDTDNITDFQTEWEAVWQMKAWAAFPAWIYEAPYTSVGEFLLPTYDHGVRVIADVYGGLSVHDMTAGDDHVLLRWPAFVRWHLGWRYWKQTGLVSMMPMPKLTVKIFDRVHNELKPQGGRLGRLVRRAKNGDDKQFQSKAKAPVAVLREHDFYAPYCLD